MIIRGLAGLLIGIAYGLLVGILVFLLTCIGLDREHPGALISDAVGMAWFATVVAALITGTFAALVGLVVGLLGMNEVKARGTGFIAGLILFLLLSLTSPRSLIPTSVPELISLLVALAVLPFGVALMSMVVAILGKRLKRYDL